MSRILLAYMRPGIFSPFASMARGDLHFQRLALCNALTLFDAIAMDVMVGLRRPGTVHVLISPYK